MQFILFALLVLPSQAFAHSAESTAGFLEGVIHPMSGATHLLAMIAVGVLSSRFGGGAVWQVPAAFIASMLVGLYLGEAGYALPHFELAISLSLLLFGGLLLRSKVPVMVVMIFAVLFFGIFHGYAHGIEIGGLLNPTGFRKGFFMGSVVIHIFGVMLGMVPEHYRHYHSALRASGVAYIAIGCYSAF